MRDKTRILNLLLCRNRTDEDNKDIRNYLLEHFKDIADIDIFLKEVSCNKIARIVYPDIFKKNQVIVLDPCGTIAIVRKVTKRHLVLGVALSKSGDLEFEESEIPFLLGFRDATDDERVMLQKALNAHNLVWNSCHCKVLPKPLIKNNQFVKISLLGDAFAYGVFKEINDAGDIILYWGKRKNGILSCSLSESLGKSEHAQIEELCFSERVKLNKDLSKIGKTWNGYKRRIESITYQTTKSRFYYFIDDYCNIKRKIENKSWQDKKQLSCGNYFSTLEEAKLFSISVKDASDKLHTSLYRLSKGESFFYINHYWVIKERKEALLAKDSKLFEVGNYYIELEMAKTTLDFRIQLNDKRLND